MAKLAVVRLRGRTGIGRGAADTLALLGLHRINNCAVVEDTPQVLGMLRKAKDYITWGTIDETTLNAVKEKRGGKGSRGTVFRLNPPKGGLGRRGIKAPFSKSGALGDRKEKVNELLMRMI